MTTTDSELWVHYQLPTTVPASVPETAVAAAQDPHEDPRFTGFAKAQPTGMLVLRQPYATTDDNGRRAYHTAPIVLVVGEHQLVTLSAQPLRAAQRLEQAATTAESPLDLAFTLCWQVFQQYTADTAAIDEVTRAMAKRVRDAAHNELLYEIMALEQSLVWFTAALTHSKALVAALQDRFPEHATLHRAAVECGQALTVAESTEEILDQYNTAISSVVANNLNLIMKMLTSVSILLAIPPIFSGIWGQNTWLPWAKPTYGFWVVLALSLGTALVVGWWLHRKDYF